MDESQEGEPIPEFYGEIENIPPVCIDTSIMQYKIAYREIHSIDSVQVDGLEQTPDEDYEVDLSQATITIYGMPWLEPNTTYYIVIQGDFGIGANHIAFAGETPGSYADGEFSEIDGGDTWNDFANRDLCFKIYGKTALDSDKSMMISHDYSNHDDEYELRDAGARSRIAQSFKTGADGFYLTDIEVWVQKIGNPVGDFRISIHSDKADTRVGGLTASQDAGGLGVALALRRCQMNEFTYESEVLVDAQGYEDGFGNLMETSSEMLEHLWTTVLGKDPDLLDNISFDDLKTARPEKICAYLNVEETFNEIKNKLEAGGLFKFIPKLDGTWMVTYYEAGISSGATELKNEDFLDFKCHRDAHSINYKVQIRYNLDPNDKKYKEREATSDIAKYLYERHGTIYIETYIKENAAAQALADSYITLFEVPQRKITGRTSGYAFDAIPTEKILITRSRADNIGGNFNKDIFRILTLTKGISTGTVDIKGLLDELSY